MAEYKDDIKKLNQVKMRLKMKIHYQNNVKMKIIILEKIR